MKIKDIKPGTTLYDCRMKSGMIRGMREACTWPVFVKEVDEAKGTIVASWNGNKAQVMYPHQFEKYRAEPRPVVRGRLTSRFATREEIKAMKKGGV